MKRQPALLLLLTIVILLLGACGGEPDTTTNTEPPDQVVTAKSTQGTSGSATNSPSVLTPDTTRDGLDSTTSETTDLPTGTGTQPLRNSREFDADADGWFNADELKAALLGQRDAFPYAPGYYPHESVLFGYVDTMVETSGHVDEHGNAIEVHGFRWEPGYEITLLYPWAECGWLQELKTAWESGDQSGMDSALDMLELLLRDFSNFDPYDHDRWKGWINEARLGDPAQLMGLASTCAEQVGPDAESSTQKFLPWLANTSASPGGCSTAYAAPETLYD